MTIEAQEAAYQARRRQISKAPNPYDESTPQHALFVALQIWDEYMSQIARCSSQDYGRLATFQTLCAKHGVTLPEKES